MSAALLQPPGHLVPLSITETMNLCGFTVFLTQAHSVCAVIWHINGSAGYKNIQNNLGKNQISFLSVGVVLIV